MAISSYRWKEKKKNVDFVVSFTEELDPVCTTFERINVCFTSLFDEDASIFVNESSSGYIVLVSFRPPKHWLWSTSLWMCWLSGVFSIQSRLSVWIYDSNRASFQLDLKSDFIHDCLLNHDGYSTYVAVVFTHSKTITYFKNNTNWFHRHRREFARKSGKHILLRGGCLFWESCYFGDLSETDNVDSCSGILYFLLRWYQNRRRFARIFSKYPSTWKPANFL